jgi:hypothetical protein
MNKQKKEHTMLRLTFVIIFVSYIVFSKNCFSQESAFPFLLISPYAETNGMGEASVANHTDDPLAFMTNPAHLGIVSQRDYFSFGYNHSYWLPGFEQSDLWLRTYAFNAGINLKKLFDITPELSFGLGYSRIYLNLGEFQRTLGPEVVGTYKSYETSDQFTLGLGIYYWVKASAGITFKYIYSKLSPVGTEQEQGEGIATVNTYDYGLLLDIPFVGILTQIREKPIEIVPDLSPFFNLSVGLAKNNLGDKKVIYIDPAQAEPIPRYARVGIGFDLGIVYNKGEVEWQPLSFKWTIEANDILVRRDSQVVNSLGWEYQDGLGDINFFDEVILGKTNPETIKKIGWELNFLEVFSIRGGRLEEDPMHGNRHFNTSGWGLRFAGIVKLLRAIDVPLATDKVIGFIVNHFDVRYNHSKITTDKLNQPLSDTKFNSINIVISN